MDMKRINAGKLRAIGYDQKERILRVEFDDGSAIDYAGVGSEVWRRFSTSGAGRAGGRRSIASAPNWMRCLAAARRRRR
jgi:hypothetical protein